MRLRIEIDQANTPPVVSQTGCQIHTCGGLADATGTGEEVGVVQAIVVQGIDQGAQDMATLDVGGDGDGLLP